MEEKTPIKAICFDWGNTLEIGRPGIVKTLQHVWKRFAAGRPAEDIFRAGQQAWKELVKIRPTKKDLADMSNFRQKLYARQAELMAEALGVKVEIPDWPWVFNDFFHEYYFTNRKWSIPRSHARLLRKLRAADIPMVVISNNEDPAELPRLIADIGLTGFFTCEIASSSFGYSKPHPKIYLAALNSLNLRADEVLFVGDDFHNDYWGPEQVGMFPLLFDPDGLHARADHVRRIDKLEKVLDYFSLSY